MSRPESHDRLLQALGLTFDICCDDPVASRDVDRLLGAFVVARDGDAQIGRRYTLFADAAGNRVLLGDGRLISRSGAWATVIGALVADLNRSAIEGFAGFAVHAGVVALGDEAVAFPAASGVGKSVLTAACVLAGFAYVSDEALCIAAGGRVVAYPKPIALSPGGWALVGRTIRRGDGSPETDKVMVTSDELGTAAAADGLRLAHVVGLARHDGPSRLVALPRSEGLAALLRMSFNHYKRPRATFALVSDLAAHCQAWRLEYSHPTGAAELLLAELGG